MVPAAGMDQRPAAGRPAGMDRRPDISHVCSCPPESEPVDIKQVNYHDRYGFYYDDRTRDADQPTWLGRTRRLGGGTFGEVYLYEARNRLGKHIQVAVKQFRDGRDFEEEERHSAAVSELGLCNIVNSHAILTRSGEGYIIMNTADGDLGKIGDLSLAEILSVDKQLSTLLFCLAQKGIYYPDLKLGNIFFRKISSGIKILMGDLGSFCSTEYPVRRTVGSDRRIRASGVNLRGKATFKPFGIGDRANVPCDKETGDRFTFYLFGLTMLFLVANSYSWATQEFYDAMFQNMEYIAKRGWTDDVHRDILDACSDLRDREPEIRESLQRYVNCIRAAAEWNDPRAGPRPTLDMLIQ